MIKVSEGVLETIYSFRGPRSHRSVSVTVNHAHYMEVLETRALKIANARMKVLRGGFSQKDWEMAVRMNRMEEEKWT